MSCLERRDRLLFQYKNSTNFINFVDGMFNVFNRSGLCSFYDFFDIELAEGDWLTVIGQLLNVDRVAPGLANVFTLDISTLDGPNVLDGDSATITDEYFRSLIYAQIMKNYSTFTINEIYEVLIFVLGIDTIIIDEQLKHLVITIDFNGDEEILRQFNSLSAFDEKWFGVPQGVSIEVIRVP